MQVIFQHLIYNNAIFASITFGLSGLNVMHENTFPTTERTKGKKGSWEVLIQGCLKYCLTHSLLLSSVLGLVAVTHNE